MKDTIEECQRACGPFLKKGVNKFSKKRSKQVTFELLIHVTERDDFQENVLRQVALSHECLLQQSPLVWFLLSSFEEQRRPKPSSAEMKEAGVETLSLWLQACDTLIFVQDPGPFPD